MAHELSIRANGFTEMAFVGQTPWHGLGQTIDPNADLNTWAVQAGMDWSIDSAPAQFVDSRGNNQFIANQYVLHRSDNGFPLSTVSNRYKPVQPNEVLEFFHDLIEENGFKMHTAGTLRGGKRMWALAETGKFGEISKADGIGAFLLLSTSCDRTLATTARFTTVRVVFNNKLSMAVNRENQHCISFSHIQKFNHEIVKQKLATEVQQFGSFLEMGKVLRKQKMNQDHAKKFLSNLITPMMQVKGENAKVEENRTYKKILALFKEEAKGVEMAGFTKWGMLNAVTEYYDHHNPARNTDSRLDTSWFGTGEKIKNKALEILLA